MRGRFYIENPAPIDAECYGKLKFHRFNYGEKPACKAWRGKQGRPYAHYTFRSPESREQWIAREKEGEDQHNAYREQHKAASAKALADMQAQIQVGTVLSGSWGYDQTNPEIWQVVERKGNAVWLRECVCEHVRGTGPDAEMIRPTGEVHGEAVKRLITPHGIKINEFCAITPTDPKAEHYHSWYA